MFSLSLGFQSKESGCCCCEVTSVVSDYVWPHRQQTTRLPHPRILQARTLEWVAISFSNAWKWKVKVKSLSHVGLLVTQWTAAYQAPPSMGFSRQEYWIGVPLPSPHVLYTYTHMFTIHTHMCTIHTYTCVYYTCMQIHTYLDTYLLRYIYLHVHWSICIIYNMVLKIIK